MERFADYDNPLVKKIAVDLVSGEKSTGKKIIKILDFARDKIKFGFLKQGDFVKASQVVKYGRGNCNAKSTLVLALCRAVNIPARIHFSLIKKEITRGIFTGLAYRFMPDSLSHSWIEIKLEDKWTRTDSYIVDTLLYQAGRKELKKRGWKTGFLISPLREKIETKSALKQEQFVQKNVVVEDHGVWEEPADYYQTPEYKNKVNLIRKTFYILMVGFLNRRMEKLRRSI